MSHRHEHEHKVKAKIKGLKPRAKALLQHVPMPGANVSWLSKDLKPKRTPSSMRVTVAMDQSGLFKAKITNGGVTEIVNLNEGLPMTPAAMYVFEFMIHKHDRINFACDTGPMGFIQVLRVEEIDSSTAQSSRQ
jgi:hypothetical protein